MMEMAKINWTPSLKRPETGRLARRPERCGDLRSGDVKASVMLSRDLVNMMAPSQVGRTDIAPK